MKKILLSDTNQLLLFVVGIILFYSIGFNLDENSSGGAPGDFYTFHYPAVLHFYNTPLKDAVYDYSSASTPLFYIINAYLIPFANNEVLLRITNLMMSLSIIYIFYQTITLKYKDISLINRLLLSSIVAISPYFKSIAIWANNDNLAYFFFIISLFNLQKYYQTKSFKYSILVITSMILATLTRQYYIVITLFLIYLMIGMDIKKLKQNSLIVFTSFILLLPFFHLINIWGGLTPPSYQHHSSFSLNSIPYIFSFITFYSLPFIIFISIDLIKNKKFSNKKVFLYIVLGITYLTMSINFSFYSTGGGFIVKVVQLIDSILNIHIANYLFLLLSMLGFIFTLYLITLSKNNIALVVPLIFLITTNVIFQKYADPMLNIFLITLISYKQHDRILLHNNYFVISLFFYNLFFYFIALIYYNDLL